MQYNHLPKIIILIFLAFLAGCQKQEANMTIGAIYNLTGEQKSLDIPSSQGVELALEKLNATGGVLGRKVLLKLVDGETNTDVIARKTQELIDSSTDMPVLIGMSDTDVTLAAAKVAAKNKRLFITSGATSPLLPEQVPDYLFLTCYGDNVQAAAAADYAYSDLKAHTVAVLYKEKMSYTELLRKYFEEAFKGLGGDVVFSAGYSAQTFADVIKKLPKTEFIYLSASPDEVISTISALRAAGHNVPILSGDGFDIGETWSELPEESNVYFTTHADIGPGNTDPDVIAFRKAYEKKYPNNEPDAFTALGYDTVMIIAAAVEKAGSLDVDAIRTALSSLQNFKGLTGNISFEKGSYIPIKSVAIFRVDGGAEKDVREILPMSIPSP